MQLISFVYIISNLLLLLFKFSNATDTLTLSQSIAYGETLVSKDGSFELGFFTPGNTNNHYLGIWYKNIPVRTVVWVANRSNPMNESSGTLMINNGTGNLVLVSKNNEVVWSSNLTKETQNPVVQLLETGNLVLRERNDGNSGNFVWQSFDCPTDTLLAGMKLGVNLKTGLDRRLTSWKNWDDPSPGDFVWRILVHNNPESTTWKGSKMFFRTGPWNGISYGGTPWVRPNELIDHEYVNNGDEVYYNFHIKKKSVISRLVMNQTIMRRERYMWDVGSQAWALYTYLPQDYCDSYGLCGDNGICIISQSPVCQCLKGFNTKSPDNWMGGYWSKGCKRNKPLNCSNNDDGFTKLIGLKLPDTTFSWVDKNMNLDECKAKCLLNCSCTAYTNFDIRNGGSGCAIWFNDLFDLREFPSTGQDIYIRMSASELADKKEMKNERDKKILATIIPAITLVFGIVVVSFCYFYKQRRVKSQDQNEMDENDKSSEEDLELPLFDLITISQATDKLSPSNKLGEGGFGPVYRGTLQDGKEIAIKRLSNNSGQGLNEFKNEVKLIAKLQHRNLVKLLGCCIEGNERMLIYEYMPNKSLDFFIFDQIRGKQLDWSKRFNIICGIARGLLYLHQDSRLRIIHRDLKASNILLDNNWNPKISDFGMAKTFVADQTEGNTKRVMGTYGYMAPEYVTDGLFSVKSDVFSFGILMLEMITGKKSSGFYHPDHSLNLIGYAWRLWKDGNSLELVDQFLRKSCHLSEVTRCIHISLLCVQQHAEARPNMLSVVVMFNSENELPQPKEPGFFKDKGPLEAESSSSKIETFSTNEMSMSLVEAR